MRTCNFSSSVLTVIEIDVGGVGDSLVCIVTVVRIHFSLSLFLHFREC